MVAATHVYTVNTDTMGKKFIHEQLLFPYLKAQTLYLISYCI